MLNGAVMPKHVLEHNIIEVDIGPAAGRSRQRYRAGSSLHVTSK